MQGASPRLLGTIEIELCPVIRPHLFLFLLTSERILTKDTSLRWPGLIINQTFAADCEGGRNVRDGRAEVDSGVSTGLLATAAVFGEAGGFPYEEGFVADTLDILARRDTLAPYGGDIDFTAFAADSCVVSFLPDVADLTVNYRFTNTRIDIVTFTIHEVWDEFFPRAVYCLCLFLSLMACILPH